MKELPSKNDLNIMWTVATSSSLESGTRPHHGFAQMLYDYLIDKEVISLGPKKSDSQTKE